MKGFYYYGFCCSLSYYLVDSVFKIYSPEPD